MQFFTKDRFKELNCGNLRAMERAYMDWERATDAYYEHLQAIAQNLPPSALEFSEQQSFHDAQLITFSYTEPEEFVVILRRENDLHFIRYQLTDAPTFGEPDDAECFLVQGKHWLYDEFHFDREKGATQQVLFSDGSELTIPLSEISVSSFEVHPQGTQDRLQKLSQATNKGSGKQARSGPTKPGRKVSAKGTGRTVSATPLQEADLSLLDHLTPVLTIKQPGVTDKGYTIIWRWKTRANPADKPRRTKPTKK